MLRLPAKGLLNALTTAVSKREESSACRPCMSERKAQRPVGELD